MNDPLIVVAALAILNAVPDRLQEPARPASERAAPASPTSQEREKIEEISESAHPTTPDLEPTKSN